MTTPNTAANGGQSAILKLTEAISRMSAAACLNDTPLGKFVYSTCNETVELIDAIEADLRASPAAVPASEPVLAWAVFGATGNLYQIVHSEIVAKQYALESKGRHAPMGEIAAAPAPASGMPDLASLLEELRDEYRSVVNSAYCQCESDDDLLGRVSAALTTDTPNPTGETK